MRYCLLKDGQPEAAAEIFEEHEIERWAMIECDEDCETIRTHRKIVFDDDYGTAGE